MAFPDFKCQGFLEKELEAEKSSENRRGKNGDNELLDKTQLLQSERIQEGSS